MRYWDFNIEFVVINDVRLFNCQLYVSIQLWGLLHKLYSSGWVGNFYQSCSFLIWGKYCVIKYEAFE